MGPTLARLLEEHNRYGTYSYPNIDDIQRNLRHITMEPQLPPLLRPCDDGVRDMLPGSVPHTLPARTRDVHGDGGEHTLHVHPIHGYRDGGTHIQENTVLAL